jgi:hypothetical protein
MRLCRSDLRSRGSVRGLDARVSVDKRLGKRCFHHQHGLAGVEERRRGAKSHGLTNPLGAKTKGLGSQTNLILDHSSVNNNVQDMLLLVHLWSRMSEFMHKVTRWLCTKCKTGRHSLVPGLFRHHLQVHRDEPLDPIGVGPHPSRELLTLEVW